MIDLSKMSLSELRSLSNEVRLQLVEAEKAEVVSARQKIEEIARSIGMPLDELLSTKIKEKKKVAVRYRHPADASLQWSGRGRQPIWVRDWLSSGDTLDKLSVGSDTSN